MPSSGHLLIWRLDDFQMMQCSIQFESQCYLEQLCYLSLIVDQRFHPNKYQIPYYWTMGTPGNCLIPIPYWLIGTMKGRKIVHQNTGQGIGDLLGQGDLVALPVGGDKNRD